MIDVVCCDLSNGLRYAKVTARNDRSNCVDKGTRIVFWMWSLRSRTRSVDVLNAWLIRHYGDKTEQLHRLLHMAKLAFLNGYSVYHRSFSLFD